MIVFCKAKLSDIVSMQELVKPEVEKGIILFRNSDEIATNIRSYILAKEDSNIVGFGALHFHADDLAEVRSLVVKDTERSKGVGKGIVNTLLEEGRQLGVKRVFTLTYKKAFFEAVGFIEIPKESLPSHKIWADCIKCKHFPICDEIALIKNL
ncbi:MAG: N-acetyltransferase [Sulfurospirillaceae bacterium]|jgi:amino-acid N-acetyltransferase|nr:N-acetyltransferase [Sulfurospirillaceae bacterium]MDD2826612.1 N-acetyltransferase [Sulfurospirillaceae bacterium]